MSRYRFASERAAGFKWFADKCLSRCIAIGQSGNFSIIYNGQLCVCKVYEFGGQFIAEVYAEGSFVGRVSAPNEFDLTDDTTGLVYVFDSIQAAQEDANYGNEYDIDSEISWKSQPGHLIELDPSIVYKGLTENWNPDATQTTGYETPFVNSYYQYGEKIDFNGRVMCAGEVDGKTLVVVRDRILTEDGGHFLRLYDLSDTTTPLRSINQGDSGETPCEFLDAARILFKNGIWQGDSFTKNVIKEATMSTGGDDWNRQGVVTDDVFRYKGSSGEILTLKGTYSVSDRTEKTDTSDSDTASVPVFTTVKELLLHGDYDALAYTGDYPNRVTVGGESWSVSGGVSPYTWSVSGFRYKVEGGMLIALGGDKVCGVGTITVTDDCGQSKSVDVRLPNGTWQPRTWLTGYQSPLEDAELAATVSIGNYAEAAGKKVYVGTNQAYNNTLVQSQGECAWWYQPSEFWQDESDLEAHNIYTTRIVPQVWNYFDTPLSQAEARADGRIPPGGWIGGEWRCPILITNGSGDSGLTIGSCSWTTIATNEADNCHSYLTSSGYYCDRVNKLVRQYDSGSCGWNRNYNFYELKNRATYRTVAYDVWEWVC